MDAMPFSQKTSFFDAMGSNKMNSIMLVLGMSFLFFILIYLFTYALDLGPFGLLFGMFAILLYAAISYFAGDSIILSVVARKKSRKKIILIFTIPFKV